MVPHGSDKARFNGKLHLASTEHTNLRWFLDGSMWFRWRCTSKNDRFTSANRLLWRGSCVVPRGSDKALFNEKLHLLSHPPWEVQAESLKHANIASWSLLRSVVEREGDRINKLDNVVSSAVENIAHYLFQQGQ